MKAVGNDILLSVREAKHCGISNGASYRLAINGFIAYNGLHPAYQSLIRTKLCAGLEPAEYLALQAAQSRESDYSRLSDSLADMVEVRTSDVEYLTGRGYDIAEATRVARAAGWCRLFRISKEQIAMNNYRLSRVQWQAKVLEAMLPEQAKGWVKFPKAVNSVRSLEQAARRLNNYELGITNYESADTPAICVWGGRYKTLKNSVKVKNSQQVSLLIKLSSDRRNLDCSQIASVYNEIAAQAGWDSISSGTVRNWREKYSLETFAGRHGTTALRNTLEMTARRVRPSAPMLMWSADGWDVELFYQAAKTTKSGGTAITYNNRLTLVCIIDPFNDYPAGYAIGTHETPELIKEALRNAANHTAELFGRRYQTYQYQSDHYALKTMLPAYAGVSEHVTPAQVRNAKSKPVERYFLYLNKNYCQYCPNWSGFGITSRKKLQPNAEAMNLVKKDFPGFDDCKRQIIQIMETERAKKREAYLKGWSQLDVRYKIELSKERYLLTFGVEKREQNTLSASGIVATIGGERKQFDCYDLEFRRNSHEHWRLMYDPADTSEVLAVSESGEKRFLLQEKETEYMALADRDLCGNKGDKLTAMTRRNDFNKLLESHSAGVVCRADEETAGLLESIPELRAALDLHKLLITDNKGQHKDRRNAVRGSGKAERYALPRAAGAEELEWYELI
jgi:hypothetical protein